jgi:two-component system response regulator
VRKSLDFVSFSETLTLLARYWLELNIPPPHPSAMTRRAPKTPRPHSLR